MTTGSSITPIQGSTCSLDISQHFSEITIDDFNTARSYTRTFQCAGFEAWNLTWKFEIMDYCEKDIFKIYIKCILKSKVEDTPAGSRGSNRIACIYCGRYSYRYCQYCNPEKGSFSMAENTWIEIEAVKIGNEITEGKYSKLTNQCTPSLPGHSSTTQADYLRRKSKPDVEKEDGADVVMKQNQNCIRIYEERSHDDMLVLGSLKIIMRARLIVLNSNTNTMTSVNELDSTVPTMTEKVNGQDIVAIFSRKDMDLADVEIVSNGSSFKAHKCILTYRSPYFRAMFSGDFKEGALEKVEISDVNSEILNSILDYMYTNLIEINADNAVFLLIAADRFLLDELKYRCEKVLTTIVSKENIFQMLHLVDNIGLHQLKAACFKVFHENRLIMPTDKIRELADNLPRIMTEYVQFTL